MVEEIFAFGKPGGAPDEQLLDAFESVFDQPRITLYVLGDPPEDYARITEHECVSTVIFDRDIGQDRPESVDISFLRSTELEISGQNLWQALAADRRLSKDGVALFYHQDIAPYTHKELLSHLEARLAVLKPLFDDNNFDFVYGQHIMYLGGMLSYLLAKTHDIPFFRIATTRISDRYTVQESIEERSPQIERAFRYACEDPAPYSTEEAVDYVDRVRNGGSLYTVPSGGRKGKAKFGIRNVVKFLRNPTKYTHTDYYYNVPGMRLVAARMKKAVRKNLLLRYKEFDDFDSSKEYAYLPLHVQPELTLMIRARYLNDFPAVIRNVAQSLPVGMELVVNEHPNMWGVRNPSFYDRLRRLPNVRVVDRSVPTSDIIEDAAVTVTINSTAGLQSLFHGTPTVTLTKPSYVVINSVKHCSSWDHLTSKIRSAMEAGVDETELIRYVATNLDVGISHDQPQDAYYRQICQKMKRSVELSPDSAWREAVF